MAKAKAKERYKVVARTVYDVVDTEQDDAVATYRKEEKAEANKHKKFLEEQIRISQESETE